MTTTKAITVLDQRGDLYNPRLYPWRRVGGQRQLVLGISGPGICPGGEGYDDALRRVRRALRGFTAAVLVLYNYGVEGWAAIPQPEEVKQEGE